MMERENMNECTTTSVKCLFGSTNLSLVADIILR